MATTTTVREAIHERLDPVIEEIVSREISQRGGYAQGAPFEALMPVLLSTLMQSRQAGQDPQRILQNILPALPALLPALLQGGQAGQDPQRILQSILPILPAVLPAILQRRPAVAQPIIQNLLPVLSALLPAIIGNIQAAQRQGRSMQTLLPVLLSSVVSRRQAAPWQAQQNPLQTLAPVLVAALSAR
jgi:hypothetical protein